MKKLFYRLISDVREILYLVESIDSKCNHLLFNPSKPYESKENEIGMFLASSSDEFKNLCLILSETPPTFSPDDIYIIKVYRKSR